MLIILETSLAEASHNLHNRMVRGLLESDAAVGYFSRRIIPLMRLAARRGPLPDIRHTIIADSIRGMMIAMPTHQPQDTVHADNT